MAKLPQFKTLDQAAEFWETHDLEDYIDDTEPVTIVVCIPRRKKVLSVPVGFKVYEQMEALAAQRGIPVARMVAAWLKDKLKEQLMAK